MRYCNPTTDVKNVQMIIKTFKNVKYDHSFVFLQMFY